MKDRNMLPVGYDMQLTTEKYLYFRIEQYLDTLFSFFAACHIASAIAVLY
jgi:hypothetical protein